MFNLIMIVLNDIFYIQLYNCVCKRVGDFLPINGTAYRLGTA